MVKKRKLRRDKITPLEKAAKIHTNILTLISNYEALNIYD
jgi:hypothetical protein